MKVIWVPRYQCSYCGKIYDSKGECRYHEKEKHKCPSCVHSYYVYGCERRCVIEEAGKNCRYKEKDKK